MDTTRRLNSITSPDYSLFNPLVKSFSDAERIDIITSFTKISGVIELSDSLLDATRRTVPIRFLTGTYLGITDPDALEILKDLCGDSIDIRLYTEGHFHPKAYFFYYPDGDADLFIGSSNLSRVALTDGVEWNYRIRRSSNKEDFDSFVSAFEELFDARSTLMTDELLLDYSNNRPILQRVNPNPKNEFIEPNAAQAIALHRLRRTRDDGMRRALIVAATGIGKTYLAAMDTIGFRKVLFIAHTEDILRQAEQSFKRIREGATGALYGGRYETDADIVFATIQSLSREDTLHSFKRDAFDYIIVDEFHHAAADTYRRVISHFEPSFMLGLTATPDRMDNRDVFILCDYNVVYEIGMKEAISNGYLCPFRYYGIQDTEVDYDEVRRSNGHYDTDSLDEQLIRDQRADLILRHYRKYGSNRCIGFCSSIRHAEYMTGYFSEKGIPSGCVTSSSTGPYSMDRENAIEDLTEGSIKVLFTVDMFNEGVDVRAIDMVMFLRPTESPTVFIQQLGRGLRTSEGKTHLTVLDFIGNYRNVDMIPALLTGMRTLRVSTIGDIDNKLPPGCFVDFDLGSLDLFERMRLRDRKLKDLIRDEYIRVKDSIGHVPTRMEFYSSIDPEILSRSKGSMFKDYLGFIDEMDDLDPIRRSFIDAPAGRFINMIEKTSMSKLYKMPILLAFFKETDITRSQHYRLG